LQAGDKGGVKSDKKEGVELSEAQPSALGLLTRSVKGELSLPEML